MRKIGGFIVMKEAEYLSLLEKHAEEITSAKEDGWETGYQKSRDEIRDLVHKDEVRFRDPGCTCDWRRGGPSAGCPSHGEYKKPPRW